MIIRKATMNDLDAISEVESECFPAAEAATKEEFRERLESYADHFLLMFDGEKLAAFIDGFVTDEPDLTDQMYENAAMHSESGKWQMIFGVNTLPEYRRRGYGISCAAALVNELVAQGFEVLYECGSDNPASVALVDRLGGSVFAKNFCVVGRKETDE